VRLGETIGVFGAAFVRDPANNRWVAADEPKSPPEANRIHSRVQPAQAGAQGAAGPVAGHGGVSALLKGQGNESAGLPRGARAANRRKGGGAQCLNF
jgi:hypothetical protein